MDPPLGADGEATPAAVDGRPTGVDRRKDDREHLSTIARGGLLNLVGAVASGLLNFVLVVIVTRGLGAAGAGAFFVAIALFSLVSKTLELGADTGLVRTIARYRALDKLQDIRPTLVVALVPVVACGTVAAVLVFVNAHDLAALFAKGSEPSEVAPMLRILASFLPIASAYTVVLAATRGFGTMVPTVLVDRIGKPSLQPLLVLVVVLTGLGTSAVVMAWAGPIGLGFVLALLWLAILVRRIDRSAAGTAVAPRGWRDLAARFWRFTAPRGLAGFFQVAIVWIDTLLIGALRSSREAGIYAAATRYTLIGTFALTAVIQVMGPKMSELIARRDHDASMSVYQVSTAWLVLMTWPVNFAIVLFTPVLVSLFGREFAAGDTPLMILGFAMFVATAVGPVDVVLLMAGKSSWNLFNTMVALVLNVGLNLLLIPPLGITGAAIAWAVSIVSNNLLPLIQTWSTLRLHPFGVGFRIAVAVTCVAYGAIGVLARLTLGQTLTGFVVYAALSSLAYLALLRRFRRGLDLAVVLDAMRARGARRRRA